MNQSGTTTATLLMSDLVDSTARRSSLGEARADQVFRRIEELQRAEVARHGGDVLKTAGDGVLAVFEAASDAVVAAIGLQRCMHARFPDHRMRIGVAAGDVSWKDGDCAGLPVITAARLEHAAEPGQILVTSVVRLLAGDRAGARYVTREPLHLKGIPEPVEVAGVEWDAHATEPAWRFPSLLAAASRQPFVGRRGERSALLARCRGGADHHALVLVSGEAGAGKTCLVADVAAEVHAAGHLVLAVACDSELALPFQAWVAAIVQLFDHLDDAQSARLAPELPDLRALGPPFDGAGPSTITGGAEAERARLFHAVRASLQVATEVAPVLLVIDDLHWAGPQALALLRHVTRVDPVPGLVVVATFRDAPDQVEDHLGSLLAELHGSDDVTRLDLGSLEEADVRELLAIRREAPPDDLDDLASRIHEHSGGNAFLASELCAHADDVRAGTVPTAVREVVQRQIRALSPGAQRLARLLAVAGARTDVRVLRAAIGDEPRARLIGDLQELLDAGLVVELGARAPGYQFRHSLQRDAVLAGLSTIQRVDLHADLATAYEAAFAADRRPVLAELTRHFASAASVLGSDKAVYYARRAAASARRTAAYDEGIDLLRVVLDPVSGRDRAALQVDLADLLLRQGRHVEAQALASQAHRAAADAGDLSLRVDAAVLLGLSAEIIGRGNEEASTLLEALAEEVPPDDLASQVRVLSALGRARWLRGEPDGLEISERALALAHEVGDPALVGQALEALSNQVDDPERGLAIAAELDRATQGSDDPWRSLWALGTRMRSLVLRGDLPEARRHNSRHRTRSDRYGYLIFRYQSLVFEAFLAFAAGELGEAEARAIEAEQLGASDESLAESGVFGLQMFMIRRQQGRLDEMQPILSLLSRRGDEAGTWAPGLACAYAETGHDEDARSTYERVMTSFDSHPRDQVWPMALSFLADTCLILEHRQTASRLIEELDRYTGLVLTAGYTMAAGPADRFRAELAALIGRVGDAHDALVRAVAIVERSESPVWQADLARAEERIARWLGASRSGSEAAAPTWPDGLSAREVEILGLVAVGCTNRDIADQLHISPNTAANHVRSILQKTGSANRTEAAAYAHRRGLPVPESS